MTSDTRDAFGGFLRVGARASMTPRPQSQNCPRYGTVLRGWEDNNFLIFDLPALQDTPVALGRDQDCVIRLVADGAVCAFRTTIVQSFTTGVNPHVFVRWPQQFDAMEIRRHQRLNVSLPCMVRYGEKDAIHCTMRDLSCGGCRIETEEPIEASAILQVSFRLPDGTELEEIECVVRNVRSENDAFHLGVQFTDARPKVGREIDFYITTCLSRLRGLQDDRPMVLVFSDRSDVDSLIQQFDEKGLNGIAATDPVDALYRMRLLQPAILIVEQSGADGRWSPDELCSMASCADSVKSTRIVLAVDGEKGESQPRGVAHVMPRNSAPSEIVRIVERFLSQPERETASAMPKN